MFHFTVNSINCEARQGVWGVLGAAGGGRFGGAWRAPTTKAGAPNLQPGHQGGGGDGAEGPEDTRPGTPELPHPANFPIPKFFFWNKKANSEVTF